MNIELQGFESKSLQTPPVTGGGCPFVETGWNIIIEAMFDGVNWYDLADRCQGITINRGQHADVGQVDTGTTTIQFNNTDGALSPWATTGPYAINGRSMCTPGVPLRVGIQQGTTWLPAFTGLTEGWTENAIALTVEATVYDMWFDLAAQTGPALVPQGASEESSDRVQRLVTVSSYRWPTRIIQETTKVVETTFYGNRLSELKLVADSVVAWAYCERDGTLVYTNQRATATKYDFGNCDMNDITFACDDNRILNSVTVAANGQLVGTTVVDAQSTKRYGPRTSGQGYPRYDLMFLTTDRTTPVKIAQNALTRSAWDDLRVEAIELNSYNYPVDVLTAIELWEICDVGWTHPSGMASAVVTSRIVGINHTISPTQGMTTKLYLVRAVPRRAGVTGTPVTSPSIKVRLHTARADQPSVGIDPGLAALNVSFVPSPDYDYYRIEVSQDNATWELVQDEYTGQQPLVHLQYPNRSWFVDGMTVYVRITPLSTTGSATGGWNLSKWGTATWNAKTTVPSMSATSNTYITIQPPWFNIVKIRIDESGTCSVLASVPTVVGANSYYFFADGKTAIETINFHQFDNLNTEVYPAGFVYGINANPPLPPAIDQGLTWSNGVQLSMPIDLNPPLAMEEINYIRQNNGNTVVWEFRNYTPRPGASLICECWSSGPSDPAWTLRGRVGYDQSLSPILNSFPWSPAVPCLLIFRVCDNPYGIPGWRYVDTAARL